MFSFLEYKVRSHPIYTHRHKLQITQIQKKNQEKEEKQHKYCVNVFIITVKLHIKKKN